MNRYQSRYRWRKIDAGLYQSPDERYIAQKESAKWLLMEPGEWFGEPCGFVVGEHLSLADCQEMAAKLEADRQVMAKLEGERP